MEFMFSFSPSPLHVHNYDHTQQNCCFSKQLGYCSFM